MTTPSLAWDAAEATGKSGLEQNADGTETAFVAARTPAWHQLGTVLPDGLTAEDVLQLGHLGGWDVHKEPLQTVGGLAVAGKFATVRTNPFTNVNETLGVVGNTYRPIQNEATLNILTTIVDESDARYDTAGSLRGGQKMFVTMKLPSSILVGGVDPVDSYLTLLNSHDGSGSLKLLITKIRVVCRNTERGALNNHESMVSIWHTDKASKTMSEIRAALDITFAYDKALGEEFEKMMQQPLNDKQFLSHVRKIWPVEKDETKLRTVGTQQRREDKLIELFASSPTMTDIAGTRWAGYNAVTEYLDYFTPVSEKRNPLKVRAERSADPANRVSVVKERAFAQFAVK